MRLMVYSHDAFGLGNIRRMLEICQYLLKSFPQLSILLVSGSPMLQGFRLADSLDYIKLPCLHRSESGELSSKYLPMDMATTLKLRAELLLTATLNFKPDLILVDKKPNGLKGELTETLQYVQSYLPQTKLVLLLRDILDAPASTIQEWQQHNYYSIIEDLYHQVLVVGHPKVFDLCQEYQFPEPVAAKVQFCGYIRKQPGTRSPAQVRQDLNLDTNEPLVVVTPGGGEDGYPLVEAYLKGLVGIEQPHFYSLVITGPEMPLPKRQALTQLAAGASQVQVIEFTPDLMSDIAAADLVVCMSGYNTITEVLSLGKPAIVVPRTKPGHEQLIRAERMQQLGLLRMFHPDELSPAELMRAVIAELAASAQPAANHHLDCTLDCNLDCTVDCTLNQTLDLEGLPRIAEHIGQLLEYPEPASLCQALQSKQDGFAKGIKPKLFSDLQLSA
jgi:predicted glycosyltransferase